MGTELGPMTSRCVLVAKQSYTLWQVLSFLGGLWEKGEAREVAVNPTTFRNPSCRTAALQRSIPKRQEEQGGSTLGGRPDSPGRWPRRSGAHDS